MNFEKLPGEIQPAPADLGGGIRGHPVINRYLDKSSIDSVSFYDFVLERLWEAYRLAQQNRRDTVEIIDPEKK